VFRYKGKETEAKSIGSELNVQSILNGRVAQRGDQLTLSLELVDVATDNAIWSQQYSRKQSDIVSLQSEIARDVSRKLQTRLSGADVEKVAKTSTTNAEAYQLYLKGRFHWSKRTPDSLKQAVAFYEQAIAEDPNYGLAYSGLAETYVLFPNYSVAMPMDSMPRAKAAALRAIELDDSLAESHVALGTYYSLFAWNQPAAEKEFRRAIELNPNYATAHQQFGIECLPSIGRFDEAVAESRRAVELDPVSPIISADFGNVLFRARRFDEAITQLNSALTLDPNFGVTRWYLGQVYHAKALYPEAVAEYRKALSFNDNPWVKAQLIRSLAKVGQRDEASKLLADLEADASRRVVSSASLALAYGALGEKDKAFAMLDKEITERNSRPPVFAINPVWDDLRDDPRFAQLTRRVEESKLD
jgi:tetratricopeptide (TPR) repeat protein